MLHVATFFMTFFKIMTESMLLAKLFVFVNFDMHYMCILTQTHSTYFETMVVLNTAQSHFEIQLNIKEILQRT